MLLVLLVLLVVFLLFGFGFALHVLWIAAAIMLVFWVAGFALAKGEARGRRGWYRW